MDKRTKIVCTIGPSSESPEMLEKMVKAGMNIARLNLSHGTHESHAEVVKNVRHVRDKLHVPLAIMWDLQGPKIRVSELAAPVEIKSGQKIVIGEDFNMDFDVSADVKKGHRVMIQDGLLGLVVDKVVGKKIYCTVKNGGLVKSHKSMNFPDTRMTMPIMTKKDMEDCRFGLTFDVDFVALSFVRNAADIRNWRKYIEKHLPKGLTMPKIIIKLELPSAVEDFDNILEEVDIVMVARGDLGVEIPASRVPIVQKSIIRKCLQVAKPVFVATQMLESMIDNPRPTRAEVSDVANAVIDGSDAVMLSAETSTGLYPVECVKAMTDIILEVEQNELVTIKDCYVGGGEGLEIAAVAGSACNLARDLNVAAIIGVTATGTSARFFANRRPKLPTYLLTENASVYRQMALLSGITPLLLHKPNSNSMDLVERAVQGTKKAGHVKKGDRVVVVVGRRLGSRINMIAVKTVE